MMRETSGWRELDSNHRSRGRPRRSRGISSRLRRLFVGGESSRADMSPSRNLLSRGTDGSNPASSSGESSANPLGAGPVVVHPIVAPGITRTGAFMPDRALDRRGLPRELGLSDLKKVNLLGSSSFTGWSPHRNSPRLLLHRSSPDSPVEGARFGPSVQRQRVVSLAEWEQS